MNFTFGTNGKLMVLGVPIFKLYGVFLTLKFVSCRCLNQTAFGLRYIEVLLSQRDCSYFQHLGSHIYNRI